MTVNLTGGIDYTQWKPVEITGTSEAKTTSTNSITYEDDSFVSNSGEKCTDGKDDGKIGFFSAIGNAIKGVGKTIVNGVKGMFTDSEGKFSLGKTLLSIGTVAACIAFPVVGVAACAIGGTMGAIQVGKGIYNAATAETDAEAKEAWQNIGGGAFTVAASVAGAKAGVKGMKSAAAKTTNGSALEALQNSGTKLTVKTAGQYGKAFVQDGVRSSKYNFQQIRTSATAYAESARNLKSAKSDYNKAKAEYNEAGKAFDNAKSNGWNETTYDARENLIGAQERLQVAEENYKFSGLEQKISNAIKHPLKTTSSTVQSGLSQIKKVKLSDVSTQLNKLGGNATKIFDTLKKGGYKEAIKNFSESEVAQVLEIVAGVTYANESI